VSNRVILWAVVLLLVAVGREAAGQFSTDARTVGMGGLHLSRGSGLDRYNPAYRGMPERSSAPGSREAKVTIPIPLGLIDFFKEHPIGDFGNDPLFDPKNPSFNPLTTLDVILRPPLFLEVKKIKPVENNWEFTIGKNELIVDLGATQRAIPADAIGIASTGRLMDVGFGFKGARVGVMGWMRYEVNVEAGDTLLAFLKEAAPAQPNTRYNLLGDVTAQSGVSPYLGWAGRIAGQEDRGLFVGATLRYYMGFAYGTSQIDGGFITGDTIFSSATPVAPDLTANTSYSRWGNSLGTGIGGDLGFVMVSGPLELGIGFTDIGATLTWKETRIERTVYDTAADAFATTLISPQAETKSKLPLGYLANVTYTVGDVAFGANVQTVGKRTSLHVGAEKRLGPMALRGGVARDQRKKLQFGFGGGVRFGPVGLDVGFWTHSTALSDQRGITMATSLSIY
jgi:hypothetical protein